MPERNCDGLLSPQYLVHGGRPGDVVAGAPGIDAIFAAPIVFIAMVMDKNAVTYEGGVKRLERAEADAATAWNMA